MMSRLSVGGRVTILVLDCATFVLLLSMVLTICLSDRVRRNAVFLNFLIVTTTNAWYYIHARIAALSPIINVPETQIQVLNVQEPTVLLMASVSLCSLVLHIATIMQNVFRPMPMKHRERIDVALIVLPYLIAPISLLEFFVTSEKFTIAISYITLASSVIAIMIDVTLLVMFSKYRLKLNQVEGLDRPVITNSILLRMSFLCVYRLFTTLAGLLNEDNFGTSFFFQRTANAYSVLLALYPTMIALVFLQKDILSVWFPFFSSPEMVSPTSSSA